MRIACARCAFRSPDCARSRERLPRRRGRGCRSGTSASGAPPPIDSAAACSSAAGLGKTKPGAGIPNGQAGLQVVPLPMLRAARCAVN